MVETPRARSRAGHDRSGHDRASHDLAPLYIVTFLAAAANGVVFPLLADLQDAHDLPTYGLGIISAASFLTALFAQLALAGQADRGRAKTLLDRRPCPELRVARDVRDLDRAVAVHAREGDVGPRDRVHVARHPVDRRPARRGACRAQPRPPREHGARRVRHRSRARGGGGQGVRARRALSGSSPA